MRHLLSCAALAVLFIAVPALPAGAQTKPAPSAAPADLVVANRKIVTLRAGLGVITPSARVELAKSRISQLDKSDLEQPVLSKASTIAGQQASAIEINGKHLVALLPEDLDPATGERMEDVVQRAVTELNGARVAYLELNRGSFILRQAALAAAMLLGFILLWYLLSRLYRRASGWVRSAAKRHAARMSPHGLDIARIASSSAERTLATLYYLVIAFGAYVCLAFSLRLFTFTHPWGDRLKGWLVDLLLGLLHGMAAAMPGLFAAFVIFLLAWLAVRAVKGMLVRVERGEVEVPGLHPDTAAATRSIASVLIWLFALTVAFPYLPGSDSDIFKGISLFAGLMVTLGSSGIVSQWMAGMTLIYSRAMRQGDLVQVGDNEGVVIMVGLLSTKIRTATGEEITIPNSSLISGSIRNFTRLSEGSGSRVFTTVTIGYDAPWRQVHAMLLEAAARTQGLRTEPTPFVLQRALSDFYVEYELVGRIDEPLERPYVMTRLLSNVQDVFNEHGVQIMSPHHMTQPGTPVVVEKRNWFAPPAKPG